MVAGARLDLVTDTSDVKRGLGDVADGVDDLGDALDNVGKDGDEASQKLERSFSKNARETKKEAREMAQDVGTSYKRMEKEGNEATKKMAQDGGQEAEQLASSFDGSAESIVDGFQGAAASMFSGFGPAGIAAGLAAAGGIGLMTASMEKAKEKATEVHDATWAMAEAIVESGEYAVTESMKIDLLREWLGDEEEQKKYRNFIDELGVSASDYGAALFDIGQKREEVEGRIREVFGEQRADVEGMLGTDRERENAASEIDYQQRNALENLRSQDDSLNGALTAAIELGTTLADVGLTIEGNKLVLDSTEEAIIRMSETDATPTFDFQPWYDGLTEFQRRLMALRAPSLTVSVRSVN